jgi:hypothetical protein
VLESENQRSWLECFCTPDPAAQVLSEVEQRRIAFHQPLGPVDGGHCADGEATARAERNEAVKDRLVIPAEQQLVVVRADAKVEGAIVLTRKMIDDITHKNQAGAKLRFRRHGVGVEHHREAVAVGDTSEDRDHLLVAFERMDVDRAAAVG